MPGRIEPLTETGIVAEMRAELARLRRGFTAAQSPMWEYQDWVLSGTPPTSAYTLTYLPYGINHVSLNGLTAREGTDYTMDYSTGILTFSASKTAGDVLSISYVTTGDLTAASGTVDTGGIQLTQQSTGYATSSVSITLPQSVQPGDLLVALTGGKGAFTISGCGATWAQQRSQDKLLTTSLNFGGGNFLNTLTYQIWTGTAPTGGTGVTVTTGSGLGIAVAIAVFRNTGSILSTQVQNGTFGVNPSTGTHTPTQLGQLVVGGWAETSDTDSGSFTDTPSTWTNLTSIHSGGVGLGVESAYFVATSLSSESHTGNRTDVEWSAGLLYVDIP